MDISRDIHNKNLGAEGERIAAAYLESLGMVILERNWHAGRKGELDIVAMSSEQNNSLLPVPLRPSVCLRIVEVKTRKEPLEGEAWEAVNLLKQKHLIQAAKMYLSSRSFKEKALHYDEIYFDVITVVFNAEGTSYKLDYIPDAFRALYL